MLIRFAVLTSELDHDFEVSGSALQNDEEIRENVLDQSIHKGGDIEFFTLDTETLVVQRVEMEMSE